MSDPKQKAQEVFFHHWFDLYNKLPKQAQQNALDEVDKKIIFDPENAIYWSEVRRSLLATL